MQIKTSLKSSSLAKSMNIGLNTIIVCLLTMLAAQASIAMESTDIEPLTEEEKALYRNNDVDFKYRIPNVNVWGFTEGSHVITDGESHWNGMSLHIRRDNQTTFRIVADRKRGTAPASSWNAKFNQSETTYGAVPQTFNFVVHGAMTVRYEGIDFIFPDMALAMGDKDNNTSYINQWFLAGKGCIYGATDIANSYITCDSATRNDFLKLTVRFHANSYLHDTNKTFYIDRAQISAIQ